VHMRPLRHHGGALCHAANAVLWRDSAASCRDGGPLRVIRIRPKECTKGTKKAQKALGATAQNRLK